MLAVNRKQMTHWSKTKVSIYFCTNKGTKGNKSDKAWGCYISLRKLIIGWYIHFYI
jgi:hypothetical protein